MKKRTTLAHLAEQTGFSIATVSMALRDDPAIKPETRSKIQQAAQRQGYQRNSFGLSLKTGQSNEVCLLLRTSERTYGLTNYLIQGIYVTLENTDYTLTVIPDFAQHPPALALERLLAMRKPSGVIITHTLPQDERVRFLLEEQLPFVTYGETEFYTPHPWHDFNSPRFVWKAVQRLTERGRSNILMGIPDEQTTNVLKLTRAFRNACEEYGARPTILSDAIVDTQSSETRLNLNLDPAHFDDCDGAIAVFDFTALAFARQFSKLGKTIGVDFDIVAKSSIGYMPVLEPEIDLVTEDYFDAGEKLANLLLDAMRDQEKAASKFSLGEPRCSW